MPSVTVKWSSESNLASGSGLIRPMPQWTSKGASSDQVTTGLLRHFATALPGIYDKAAKFRSHNIQFRLEKLIGETIPQSGSLVEYITDCRSFTGC
jgi:hypothetical protein